MRTWNRKKLLVKAMQAIGVVALGAGVFVVALGLLPPRVEAWLRTSAGDDHLDQIRCERCGGTMEVRNRLSRGLKVYACRSCQWALWPDSSWKAPAPQRDPSPTWHGDR